MTLVDTIPIQRTAIDSDLGFEAVTRALALNLMSGLNDEIAAQRDKWLAADLVLQQMGATVGQVDVPLLPATNFFEGPHRSLIEAPVEMFPNVSVMAFMATTPPTQAFDQVASSILTLFVECMAISGPVGDGTETSHETIVFRRIARMTEAAKNVVERDPLLMGTVHRLQTPPQGGIGNSSWKRPKEAGAGPRYIIHGSRLQYTATRHHT